MSGLQALPPQPGTRPGTGRSGNSNAVWWVIIALVTVALIGIIVWAVVGRDGPGPTSPSTPATSEPLSQTSAPVTPDPTVTDPTTRAPVGPDWGDFPPRNLDSLRDLSGAAWPEIVGGFELAYSSELEATLVAQYDDLENFRTFAADVSLTADVYRTWTSRLVDPQFIGDALCGWGETQVGVDASCIMAGQDQVLRLSTLGDEIGLEELAALTEELYETL